MRHSKFLVNLNKTKTHGKQSRNPNQNQDVQYQSGGNKKEYQRLGTNSGILYLVISRNLKIRSEIFYTPSTVIWSTNMDTQQKVKKNHYKYHREQWIGNCYKLHFKTTQGILKSGRQHKLRISHSKHKELKQMGRTCNQAKSQPLTHAARRWTDDMEKKVKTYRPEERGIGITGRKSLC